MIPKVMPPLAELTVLVTRPASQAAVLCEQIQRFPSARSSHHFGALVKKWPQHLKDAADRRLIIHKQDPFLHIIKSDRFVWNLSLYRFLRTSDLQDR